jgi:hypothetical protein
MKVIRTFHPVGQGAFYSERFYEEDAPLARYNIVYDCGTSWGNITKAKKVVTQAFDKNDTIDYLFISHLDYDHVSLVNTLIDSVGKVRNIVLPLIKKDEVIIGISLNSIANHQETVDFLNLILGFIAGSNNVTLDTNVSFVGGDDDRMFGRYHSLTSGKEIPLPNEQGEPEWVLIPRNISSESRRHDLIEGLDKMLVETDFKRRAADMGLPSVESGEELLNQLLDEEYVASVIKNAKLKNAIKSAYEKVAGGVNVNSLLLYSGPAKDSNPYEMWRVLPDLRRWLKRRKAGCLYTGDSDCDIPVWQKGLFYDVWKNIGTIQLPHHGSQKSFDIKKNEIDRSYFFPVSCGGKNSYGHPSGKVLSYLISRNCLPQIITEMSDTVYMQYILSVRNK